VFSKEAILWNQLNHPNVLPFYGVYYLEEERRRICLVSPWMENGNIVRYLQENPHAPRRPFVSIARPSCKVSVVDLCIEICDVIKGLEYLHRKNIIHGDLKGVGADMSSVMRNLCLTLYIRRTSLLLLPGGLVSQTSGSFLRFLKRDLSCKPKQGALFTADRIVGLLLSCSTIQIPTQLPRVMSGHLDVSVTR
jgi:serine/threonine protein kinase